MPDLYMRIYLNAVDNASKTAAQVSKVLGGSTGIAGSLLMVAGAATIATTGLGVMAAKAAGDFNAELTSLVTGAGEAQGNLKMVGDGVLQLANDTATSTKQLTDGLYMIESAGYHGANGLNVLKTAAQGAKVGNADLGVVSNALTTILTDYHMKSDQATGAMNALVTTVASGKTHMQDLASSLGSVLPLASSLNISLPQTAGAIATMTNAGMDAQRASMNLANAIRSLAAPNKMAEKSMQEVGISAQQLHDVLSQQGLSAALQMVEDHVGKKFPAGSVEAVEAFKHIMGGATGYNVALMLGGKNMDIYKNNVDAISKSLNSGSKDVQGWSLVQQDFNFKVAQAKEKIETLGIKVGEQLLPAAGKLLDTVMPLVTQFADWLIKSGALQTAIEGLSTAIKTVADWVRNSVQFFQHNQAALEGLKIAVVILAGVIGGIMVAALVSMAVAAWAAIVPLLPFIAIGALVALVVYGIVLAIQHWGDIVKWFQGLWAAVSAWFMGILGNIGAFFVSIWTSTASFFANLWFGIISGLKSAWTAIIATVVWYLNLLVSIWTFPFRAIAALFSWLYQHNKYFKMLIDAIVGFVRAGLAWLQNAWQVSINWLVARWQWVVGIATTVWGIITGAIQVAVNAVRSVVVAVWTFIAGWLGDRWAELAGLASKAWAAVSAVFSGIWNNYIAGPLGKLWNFLQGWFGQLAQGALDSGKNFINMLVSGITSGAGKIWDAVVSIAQNIWKALGFQSPAKAGPGATADKWMPNLISMLSTDLMAGAPKLQAAASVAIQPVAATLFSGRGIAPSGVSASHTSNSTVTVVHNHYYQIGTMARSQTEVHRLVTMINEEQARQMRVQTPGYAAGGVY